ncbi:sulfatase-like hydrolase/transferase [Celeribacter litoreus]|uniref:sulfatase-like hydrolase/transferase n=1 Tax=Celeribacter litoreus TaxID=2876714 RepID=UPI001CCEB4A1|nr:sulfatase-like hydrolase/transferase [Celeribacter litoreus]MCA0045098.1 sulfatase-like hydrolase/transferase [Celeribacter litoreus]
MQAKELGRPLPSDGRSDRVLWTGALAGLALFVLRLIALRPDMDGLRASLVGQLFLQGIWQDWLILLLLTYGVLTFLRGAARPVARRMLTGMYVVSLSVILLWGAVNITALRMLGAPVTADWVAYSDVAHTDVIFDSLPHVLSMSGVLMTLSLLVVVFGGARVLARERFPGAGPLLGVYGVSVVLGLALISTPVAGSAERRVNPLVAFARSFSQSATPDALILLQNVGDVTQAFERVSGAPRPSEPAIPIRNVVFFAYESTPARQTQGWEGAYPVTPNLAAALDHGIAFDRAYAHVPASNYFLVSAFAGIVPELSSVSMTETHTADNLPNLPSVLGAAGMRTAWFNSADNRFQNTGGFLTAIGFDHVVDYRDWTCEEGVFEVTNVTDRFRNTSSDLCTADQMKMWLDDDPDAPFFLAFRTGMTHYPYFPGQEPQTYVEDETYNRYLNALRVGDEAFGELMAHLEARGLLEETLIVVMGDHGEAFGEHGTYVHAASIYEENVHVPMAFINPQLFSGSRSDVIVSISDAAATITDLLGIETPPQWEGQSVFAETRPHGAIFFAPWNGFQIGFTDGDRKFIINANSGEAELYDLATDPYEKTDIALSDPGALADAQRVMAAAVSVHKARMAAILSGELPTLPKTRATEIVLTVSGTAFGEAPKGWVFLDGEDIGGFEVASAPDTSNQSATRDEINAAFMDIRLPVILDPCSRELEIYFTNDKWAGEGLTGDIDLLLRRVMVDGVSYTSGRFTELSGGGGGIDGTDYRFYRKGGITIGLELSPACLTTVLAVDSP